MDTENLIRAIVDLPGKFREVGNKSIISLLKESGYVESFTDVNENNIADFLKKNPDKIMDWLIWSDDKRSYVGWYFIEEKDNHFLIGYLPKDDKVGELRYSDKIQACAAFIKRELEYIRLKYCQ
jgi:hypothetical protein